MNTTRETRIEINIGREIRQVVFDSFRMIGLIFIPDIIADVLFLKKSFFKIIRKGHYIGIIDIENGEHGYTIRTLIYNMRFQALQ